MRRRFEPIQRRVETGTEGRPTRLTAQPLDPLSLTTHSIANQRMDVRITDPVVLAGSVGTGKASVCTRFGDPLRLFTSRQGRTAAGSGLLAEKGAEERQQAGQSKGERGLRRRRSRERHTALE